MELKGIITIPKGWDGSLEQTSLSCCSFLPKILIGEKNLHDELYTLFGQSEEAWFERQYDTPNPKIIFAVKYVILDKEPDENFDLSFNDLALSIIDGWEYPMLADVIVNIPVDMVDLTF